MAATASIGDGNEARPMLPRIGRLPSVAGAREFFVFLLFGGTAAIVNLTVGWTLYGAKLFPALPYWAATGSAAAAGLVINFALNYTFNFRCRERSALRQFATFCAVALLGVALTSVLSDMLLAAFEALRTRTRLGLSPVELKFAAHAMAVALVAIYSFFGHKYVSFNIGIRGRLRQLKLLISTAS